MHKNLAVALEAAGELKRRGLAVPLVLAGYGTERIGDYGDVEEGHPLFEYGRLSRIAREQQLIKGVDLFTLGYVSDVEIDALIRHAMLLVAPSRYEAGSGPAVDAWSSGTPVVMSAIPPFLEQLDYLGTKAWTFDPDSPNELADAIEEAVGNPTLRDAIAAESRDAIARRTWTDIAREYRDVFDRVASRESAVQERGVGT